MKIKISRNGKAIGEYSPAVLRIKLRDRAVLPTDHYWFEGMSGWELVSSRKTWADFNPLPANSTVAQPHSAITQPSAEPQSTMKGVVLDYNISTASGVVSTDAGLRYGFVKSDWKSSQKKPAVGLKVEFVVSGANATEIYALQQPFAKPTIVIPPRSRKSRGIYVLLALFLGVWGVHNFYAGYDHKAKWMLGMGLVGIILFIPAVITFFISIYEAFTVTKDGYGVPFD